jgi:hypothetical protein
MFVDVSGEVLHERQQERAAAVDERHRGQHDQAREHNLGRIFQTVFHVHGKFRA